MEHLSSLCIDGIPVTDPPPIVASQGPAHLLHYLRLKRASSVFWNALRVVVVGPQGSGKTCLISKLRGESWTTASPTKGLEVRVHVLTDTCSSSKIHTGLTSPPPLLFPPPTRLLNGNTKAQISSPSATDGLPLTFGTSVVILIVKVSIHVFGHHLLCIFWCVVPRIT